MLNVRQIHGIRRCGERLGKWPAAVRDRRDTKTPETPETPDTRHPCPHRSEYSSNPWSLESGQLFTNHWQHNLNSPSLYCACAVTIRVINSFYVSNSFQDTDSPTSDTYEDVFIVATIEPAS